MKNSKPTMHLLFFFLWLFTLIGCGTSSAVETLYSQFTWGKDEEEIFYVKNVLDLMIQKNELFFIGQSSESRAITSRSMYICVNDFSGNNEIVIGEIDIGLNDFDYEMGWMGESLVIKTGDGAWTIDAVEGEIRPLDTLPVLNPLVRKWGDYSLLQKPGSYGNRVIFMADHENRTMSTYLRDPMDKSTFVPQYTDNYR